MATGSRAEARIGRQIDRGEKGSDLVIAVHPGVQPDPRRTLRIYYIEDVTRGTPDEGH